MSIRLSLPSRRGASLLAVLVVVAGACSSNSRTSTPKPPPPSTKPTKAVDLCRSFQRLSALDQSATAARDRLANDWRVLRAVIVAANDTNQQIYPAIVATTTGTTRAAAQRVSAFLPRSRTVALRSFTLDGYLNAVHRLPGDAEVEAAATLVVARLTRSCHGVAVPPSAAPASAVGVVFHVGHANGVPGRAHIFYYDPAGIPVVLDVATPWSSSPVEYAPGDADLRLVATSPGDDSDVECEITVHGGNFSGASGFGSGSCGIGTGPPRPTGFDEALGPPI